MNGIIDVGSNSVRLLFDGKKTVKNTQLAEGLMTSGVLKREAMLRTADAVTELRDYALKRGAEDVFAFATEAVRSAKNGGDFLRLVRERNVKVELIPPETEGKLGFDGAYNGGRPAVMDIGGASSEVTVGDGNGIVFSHSMPLGSVRLKDYAPDKKTQLAYARKRVAEYGCVPKFDKLISIGGSVSQLSAVFMRLDPYDPDKVHNSVMTYDQIERTVDEILAVPVEQRVNIVGLHPKKIIVAPAGGILALAIMEYLGVNETTLSERDNLEGYAVYRNIAL